jgi:hypothetical protein
MDNLPLANSPAGLLNDNSVTNRIPDKLAVCRKSARVVRPPQLPIRD